ncbi:MAG: stage III sporulation protein AB [Anaerovoracaceae bacterium]
MLKMIGLIALVAAAGFSGVRKAAELKERIRLLEDFLKMMLALKSRIDYFKQPLLPLFQQTAAKEATPAYILLDRCQKELRENQGEIRCIWIRAAKETYRNTPLTKEDIQSICHLGSFIGQTDYENQKMQFDYLEKRLEEQLAEAREESRVKGPMFCRIGFFGGTVAALVLL